MSCGMMGGFIFIWIITSLCQPGIKCEYAVPRKLVYSTTMQGSQASLPNFIDSFKSDLALCGNSADYERVRVYKTTSKYCDLTRPGRPLVRSCRRLCGYHDKMLACEEKCPKYYECTWSVDQNQTLIDFCNKYYDYPDKWIPPTTGTTTLKPTTDDKVTEMTEDDSNSASKKTIPQRVPHETHPKETMETEEQPPSGFLTDHKIRGYLIVHEIVFYSLSVLSVFAVLQFLGIMAHCTGCCTYTSKRLRDCTDRVAAHRRRKKGRVEFLKKRRTEEAPHGSTIPLNEMRSAEPLLSTTSMNSNTNGKSKGKSLRRRTRSTPIMSKRS